MALQLRRLTPADLEYVIALEYKLFPREFCYSVAKTQEILSIPHVKGKNYSVGAFDGDVLVGYILMFDAPSELYPGETVALVWELAVAMRYRVRLSKPFMEWIIREAHRCGLIVETRLRERTALKMVNREAPLISSSRYRVTAITPHASIGDERMVILRFEAVRTPLHGVAARIDTAGMQAERLRRVVRLLPLRLARQICYRLPSGYVPLPVLQLTYLAPRGAEPANVRTDVA